MRNRIKQLIIRAVPLSLRKVLAKWVNRATWLGQARGYYATELLTDFAKNDVNAYHKFLWRHHLAYAKTYDIESRFGYDKFNASRKEFFAELPRLLSDMGIDPSSGIDSVLDIGCSLGYLLRYIETDLFPEASRLVGIDIDANAIAEGAAYLRARGSRIVLNDGDMESIGAILGDERFDLVLGLGVLLYLDQASASEMVAAMIKHTNKLVAITALANLDFDNSQLLRSVPRERDGTWVHNVDEMICNAGGVVVARRWESRIVDGNTIYFLFARPKNHGAIS